MSKENKDDRLPTIVIECDNGTVIRIYQELSEEYIRELIAEFRK